MDIFSDLSLGTVVTQLFIFLYSQLGYPNNNLGQYYNFLLLSDLIDINMSYYYLSK